MMVCCCNLRSLLLHISYCNNLPYFDKSSMLVDPRATSMNSMNTHHSLPRVCAASTLWARVWVRRITRTRGPCSTRTSCTRSGGSTTCRRYEHECTVVLYQSLLHQFFAVQSNYIMFYLPVAVIFCIATTPSVCLFVVSHSCRSSTRSTSSRTYETSSTCLIPQHPPPLGES